MPVGVPRHDHVDPLVSDQVEQSLVFGSLMSGERRAVVVRETFGDLPAPL